MWSGQRDSNPRPSAPKADALPDCAMPRAGPRVYNLRAGIVAGSQPHATQGGGLRRKLLEKSSLRAHMLISEGRCIAFDPHSIDVRSVVTGSRALRGVARQRVHKVGPQTVSTQGGASGRGRISGRRRFGLDHRMSHPRGHHLAPWGRSRLQLVPRASGRAGERASGRAGDPKA
jgi:hypothetical protein